MSELGDDFAAWAKFKQEKKAGNRQASADLLKEKQVWFESKNGGAHLVVTHNDMVADFWPGTGKWSVRGSGQYHRGVFGLLKRIGVPT